jgi:hypothetical protein
MAALRTTILVDDPKMDEYVMIDKYTLELFTVVLLPATDHSYRRGEKSSEFVGAWHWLISSFLPSDTRAKFHTQGRWKR